MLEPNAVIAVDVVLFTLRPEDDLRRMWQVLLVEPRHAAFAGKLALPGVLARQQETFDQAARRALQSKAGLDARSWYLEQLATFGDPGRDSRGRVVSVAHLALVRSDDLELIPGCSVARAEWAPVREVDLDALAFDHGSILRRAIERVQSKLRYSWVAFQLLPETFTLAQLRAVYAAILDPAIARLSTSNFRKAFAALFLTGALVQANVQPAPSGRPGRPGRLYRFQGPVMGRWPRELPWSEDRDLAPHQLGRHGGQGRRSGWCCPKEKSFLKEGFREQHINNF